MIEPDFLTLEDVLWIHEQQLELYGGQAGIRDQGLLESAVAMPRQTFGARAMTKQAMADVLRKLPRGDQESDPRV